MPLIIKHQPLEKNVSEKPLSKSHVLGSKAANTSSYVLVGVCTIIAAFLFIALLFMQWTELADYQNIFP